jgi:hypothetical protein
VNAVGSPIPGFLLSCAFLMAIAVVHALIAWSLARRFGFRVLPFSAVAASLAVFGLFVALLASRMRTSGVPVGTEIVAQSWPYVIVPLLISFGLSSISIRKSLLQTDALRPSFGATARAVGAFFAGYGVALLGTLVFDFARIGW